MSKKFDVEAYLRDILDFHPRAANLMMKRKPFVVVACDEPYYMQVYSLIREHEMKIGCWSKEDERNYQAAEQCVHTDPPSALVSAADSTNTAGG